MAVFTLACIAAAPAHAFIEVETVTAPTRVADPYSSFTITYSLTGSSQLSTAQVRFYLAPSPLETVNRVRMSSRRIQLRQISTGLYLPPSGTQAESFSYATVEPGAQAVLGAAAAACGLQNYYIQVEVDFSSPWGDNSLFGTSKLPDFFFTAGTLSPSTITPGGTVSFTADLYTPCPVSSPSTVGVFLADANYQLLSYIGPISVGTGVGTFPIPSTSITFSTAIAPGTYYLVLAADVNSAISESNENNNTGAFAFQIVASQPLTVQDSASALDSDLPGPVREHIEQYAPTIGFVDGYASLSR
ncbi:hypothetical protein HI113_10715 [Corallococcus exiguus]|uniref:CARDB domain-containing protein n=1 Tax=Corallococcus exiguus TaxID=83462 RepID=UPI0014731DCD|nr:CARDB domain-containing protein [Corallococcus exiguus]NNB94375.1 hypothetical protein [Corallococcus exiguus]